MKHLLAYFTVIFTAFGYAFSANAQVVQNRDSAEAYFQRGANFYEDHRAPTPRMAALRRMAMANYSKSIAFDSRYYWSYRNLGYCHQNFGDYELALDAYNRAVLAGSRSNEADAAFVHFNCIEMCQRLKKWTEAEAHCSALLANPHICAGTYCRGTLLDRAEARVQLKKYAEAKQDYLAYQQQTAAELAVARQELATAQQKLARATPQPKHRHLSKRERARLEDGWGELSQKSSDKEPTQVETLEQESQVAMSKLVELEKLMRP
jgi:tetratricopeptide (TPR) repeat protein